LTTTAGPGAAPASHTRRALTRTTRRVDDGDATVRQPHSTYAPGHPICMGDRTRDDDDDVMVGLVPQCSHTVLDDNDDSDEGALT